MKYLIQLFVLGFVASSCAQDVSQTKRVYSDARVGQFDSSFDLGDCHGNTFLQFMKDTIFPAIEAQASQDSSSAHIDAVALGQGVELRLTEDVSTLHVKYKAHWEPRAERSGRSFSAVGDKENNLVEYVADASYAHYFDSFERTLGYDNSFLPEFYSAIFGVLTQCDASEMANLNKYQKRIAADFIAVYVAEQYRHLIPGEGEYLGRSHQWDDALLQTTMLIAFHAGQSDMQMYYKGEFTDRTYPQYGRVDGEKFCAYKNWNDPRRQQLSRRPMELRDYWQPNRTCERSGVNLTRRDFEKMGRAITSHQYHADEASDLYFTISEDRDDLQSRNLYENVSKFFISNDAPQSHGSRGDQVVANIVDYLMLSFANANEITEELD